MLNMIAVLAAKAMVQVGIGQLPGERNPIWGPNGEPPVRRFPIPEFEAMKALLAKGIRVNPAEVEPTTWMSRYEEAPSRDTVLDAGFTTRAMIRKGWLKGAKPSLFKTGAEVAFDHAGLDRLAALSGDTVRLRVLRGPEYYYDYDTQVSDGAWDVGEVAMDFSKPPVFHAVGKSGLVRKGLLASRRMVVNRNDSRCVTEGLHLVPTDVRPLPDTPKVSDPLVMFYLPEALPRHKVGVTVRQATLPVVAIWANLGGVWRLVSFAAEPDCT